MTLSIEPIRWKTMKPPQDDFFAALAQAKMSVRAGDIIVVSSKIVAIHQGRTIPIKDVSKKDTLILKEAERYVPREEVPHGYALLTIKNHTLISSAGIDESNGNGYYILWPEHIQEFCKQLWEVVTKKYRTKKIGVVVADSHSIPLRHGATGIGIGFYGFEPLKKYKGKKDIFGRPFKFERVNLVDSFAGAAVLAMGEGKEKTPVAVVRGSEGVRFSQKDKYKEWVVELNDDIYQPLLKIFQKKKKGTRSS